MKKQELELTRRGCTPSQFAAYVRQMLKKHGIDYVDIDFEYWKRGNDIEFEYQNEPGRPCQCERSVSKPYQMQTYVRNWNGTTYNLIMEFDHWDEKTGHGYFYFLNTLDENTTDTTTTEAKGEDNMTRFDINQINRAADMSRKHSVKYQMKKEGENTMTPTTTTRAAEIFPRLYAEIGTNYDRRTVDLFQYIEVGYMPTWNPEYQNNPDRGLKQYSTPRRWEQYQSGDITREKAVELAKRRAVAEIEKSRAAKLARIESAAAAPAIDSASVSVTWAKSRTWGANPTAELLDNHGVRTMGHASGCGYDKESAAIAEAMNENPSALRILYELGEKALERGESPKSKTACSGYHWGCCIGYGAGYDVLPYYEGGVGSSCFWSILQKAGYTVRHAGGGRMFDCWTFYRA